MILRVKRAKDDPYDKAYLSTELGGTYMDYHCWEWITGCSIPKGSTKLFDIAERLNKQKAKKNDKRTRRQKKISKPS